MKKLIKDPYVFIRYFNVRQEVNDEIQTINSYIKDELQNSIEKNIFGKTGKTCQLHGDGLKALLTMNPMGGNI